MLQTKACDTLHTAHMFTCNLDSLDSIHSMPDQDLQAGLNRNPRQAVDVQMQKGYLALQLGPDTSGWWSEPI